MADIDHHSLDGTHYRGAPAFLVADLGRLAVLAGQIEYSAYSIAGSLGLARPKNGRSPALAAECRSIIERLGDPRRPAWIDGALPWSEEVTAWASATPKAVDSTRNLYIHAVYPQMRTNDAKDWRPVMLHRIDITKSDPVTPEQTGAAVKKLEVHAEQGISLWAKMLQVSGAARAHKALHTESADTDR